MLLAALQGHSPKRDSQDHIKQIRMPIRMAIIIYKRKITSVGEDGRNYNISARLVGM